MLYKLGRGFTAIETIVAVGISILIGVLIAPLITMTMGQMHSAGQKAEILELNLELIRWIRKSACACHLDRDQNTARAAALSLDTTNSIYPNIDLGVVRESCDFTAADNIIVEAARPLPRSTSRLQVDQVLIRDIRPVDTGRRYSAELFVSFRQDGPTSHKPISIGMSMEIDTSSGLPSSRKILNCGFPAAKNIVACPGGMELIGYPGAVGTFCVETAPRPAPPTYSAAAAACQALPVNPLGTFRICPIEKLTLACQIGRTLTGLNGTQWEMVDNAWQSDDPNDNHLFAAGAGCGSLGMARGFKAYRCCLTN